MDDLLLSRPVLPESLRSTSWADTSDYLAENSHLLWAIILSYVTVFLARYFLTRNTSRGVSALSRVSSYAALFFSAYVVLMNGPLVIQLSESSVTDATCSLYAGFSSSVALHALLYNIFITLFNLFAYRTYYFVNSALGILSSCLRTATLLLAFAFHAEFLGVYIVVDHAFTLGHSFLYMVYSSFRFPAVIFRVVELFRIAVSVSILKTAMESCDHPVLKVAIVYHIVGAFNSLVLPYVTRYLYNM